jgi:V8-like Glu-specific endopeptidase
MKDSSIYHTCSTDFGSSGSPILSLKTFKVLGIHFGASHLEFNRGTFIKYAIDDFFKNIDDISCLNPFQLIKENN